MKESLKGEKGEKYMKNKYILLAIILSASLFIKTTSNIITLFIKDYPNPELPLSLQTETDSENSRIMSQPSYVQPKKEITPVIQKKLAGVWGLYKGYAQATNFLGQLSFPRKQQANTINLIITKKITPAFIVGPSTVGYWQIDSSEDAAVYEIDIEYSDDANTYYFETKKIDTPENGQISLQSIIIPADPETVYVPEGAVITEYTANLTLPDIYIKTDSFDFEYNASYTLSLKNYFAQIDTELEQDDAIISKLMNLQPITFN